MTDTLNDLRAKVPNAELIGEWESVSKQLGEEIAKLSQEKEHLDKFIVLAKATFGGELTPEKIASVIDRPRPDSGSRVQRGSWMQALYRIAVEHPSGISYDEAREKLPEGLKEQVELGNTKAFYGSMRRLERDGQVVRYNSHIFTPEGFERFKRTTEFNSLSKKGAAKRGSPIGNAVLAYLAANGPSKGLAIKDHLCETPEFRTPLMRNSSALYNVLKRLTNRNEIYHDKENALFSLPNDIEAPSDQVAGASEAGEVAASPDENRSLFRLIG